LKKGGSRIKYLVSNSLLLLDLSRKGLILNSNMFQKIGVWLIVGLVLFTVFKQFDKPKDQTLVTYSQFMDDAKAGKVKRVDVQGRTLQVTPADGNRYSIISPGDIWMVGDLMKYGVQVTGKADDEPNLLVSALYYLGPTLLIIGFWFFMMRQMQGGGKGGAFSFGKSKARLIDENSNTVTFADVAGCDEAKEEVFEIVDFLRDPQKFQKLGGRIPHGVLLVGPPGTGKTLLARAIAGEAKVPFFSISGSDFVEMFVGVGASRVRDMFENAKKNSPCIIFIDEIDAVGRHRGAGMGGGNDEREQTLNQMLVEMDGFESNSGVIVVAATNRSDVLDRALLRPGRFDRQVHIGLPDIRGREQILQVHMRKVPIDPDVNAAVLARGTPGFSGADLANLVNESALFAARRGKRAVDMKDFEDAKDKIYMGPERKSAVMREEERRNTAYHESGHAVVAKVLPKADPVHKVTIMPRGMALGVTWQLPEFDRVNLYKDRMMEELAILFGGRAAEEVFLHSMSTGASNDFERATKMARDMVTRYGMSDSLGTMVYVDTESESIFGRNSTKTVSELTQQKVDAEIRALVDSQYALARSILEQNRDKVEAMVAGLLEWETLDAEQITDIMEGRPPRAPKPSPATQFGNSAGTPGPAPGAAPATA
jgi:cell division protease FtsH